MGDVDFDQIGEDFATYYYKCLDSNNMEDLANLYTEESMMTWEKDRFQGVGDIIEKFKGFTFESIDHDLVSCDCQPSVANGINVVVTGRVKFDDDPPHFFSQFFHLVPVEDSYVLSNDIFRFIFMTS